MIINTNKIRKVIRKTLLEFKDISALDYRVAAPVSKHPKTWKKNEVKIIQILLVDTLLLQLGKVASASAKQELQSALTKGKLGGKGVDGSWGEHSQGLWENVLEDTPQQGNPVPNTFADTKKLLDQLKKDAAAQMKVVQKEADMQSIINTEGISSRDVFAFMRKKQLEKYRKRYPGFSKIDDRLNATSVLIGRGLPIMFAFHIEEYYKNASIDEDDVKMISKKDVKTVWGGKKNLYINQSKKQIQKKEPKKQLFPITHKKAPLTYIAATDYEARITKQPNFTVDDYDVDEQKYGTHQIYVYDPDEETLLIRTPNGSEEWYGFPNAKYDKTTNHIKVSGGHFDPDDDEPSGSWSSLSAKERHDRDINEKITKEHDKIRDDPDAKYKDYKAVQDEMIDLSEQLFDKPNVKTDSPFKELKDEIEAKFIKKYLDRLEEIDEETRQHLGTYIKALEAPAAAIKTESEDWKYQDDAVIINALNAYDKAATQFELTMKPILIERDEVWEFILKDMLGGNAPNSSSIKEKIRGIEFEFWSGTVLGRNIKWWTVVAPKEIMFSSYGVQTVVGYSDSWKSSTWSDMFHDMVQGGTDTATVNTVLAKHQETDYKNW